MGWWHHLFLSHSKNKIEQNSTNEALRSCRNLEIAPSTVKTNFKFNNVAHFICVFRPAVSST